MLAKGLANLMAVVWNHSSAIISCPETRSRLSPKQLDVHIVQEAHRSELLRLENLPQGSEEIEWKRARRVKRLRRMR
jgi:hypothetical protein